MAEHQIGYGHFADPAVEKLFREHAWPEWSLRLRIVALIGAILVCGFAYTDYLDLGLSPALYVCWFFRGSLVVAAIIAARVTLGPPRPGLMDLVTLCVLLLFGLTLHVVVALQDHSLMFQAPGAILMVLAFYLFLPTRFDVQLVSGLFASAGTLGVALLVLGAPRDELTVAAGELLICNALGAFTALRWHASQRREYARQGELQRRADFEHLVARLSTRFITASAEQATLQILEALGEAGAFAGADRAFVFQFDRAERMVSCSHEWCRPGIPPAMRMLQRVPFDSFTWGMHELMAGRPLVASRLEDFPEAGARERVEAERHGVRSLLVLPLVFGGRVLGAIGFHAVRSELEWTEERVAMLRISGDMIIGVLAHRRSRDQLAAQSRSLDESVAALEKSNAELRQFAHVASHDLQEPLRSISSFSSLLSDRYAGRLDTTADEYLEYLRSAANRMHELVTSLLSYSSVSQEPVEFTRVEMGAVQREVLERLKGPIRDAGAQVITSTLPAVRGNHEQIVVVFRNLVDNALKFRGALEPRIVLGVQRVAELWEFSVSDNGIGVEPRFAERIFQPFTRLHGPGKYPGTGIGLATARRIVERHGGALWVESDGIHGATFRFTLPAAAPPAL